MLRLGNGEIGFWLRRRPKNLNNEPLLWSESYLAVRSGYQGVKAIQPGKIHLAGRPKNQLLPRAGR
jgi:hypothetical protein